MLEAEEELLCMIEGRFSPAAYRALRSSGSAAPYTPCANSTMASILIAR